MKAMQYGGTAPPGERSGRGGGGSYQHEKQMENYLYYFAFHGIICGKRSEHNNRYLFVSLRTEGQRSGACPVLAVNCDVWSPLQ